MSLSFIKHIYPSGLTLLSVPMPSVRSFTALVLVNAGSRYETKKINGLTHFLEHMVFKGTKKYPTAQAVAAAVDSIGAEFNAFTSTEYTGYYIKAASQHLDFALNMLSQLVFHPLLRAKDIDRERGVIIEEINMYEDNPMYKVSLVFEELMYGNTPLGWRTIGTKQNIQSVQRSDFTAYMHQRYQPNYITVSLAGSFGNNSTEKLVANYFSSSKKAKPRTGLGADKKFHFTQTKPAVKVFNKKTEQAHFCLGVRTFPRGHKQRYALGLLSTILGGNMSSRLFSEVREKRGLAYYIRTSTQYYLDNGYLVTQAGTDTKKAGEAAKIIRQEYERIAGAKYGLTAKELIKAKEYLKGKLVLSLEDTKDMADLYAEDHLLEGKTRTPVQILKDVDQVSLEEIVDVAKQIFKPANLNLAVVGPYNKTQKLSFSSLIS